MKESTPDDILAILSGLNKLAQRLILLAWIIGLILLWFHWRLAETERRWKDWWDIERHNTRVAIETMKNELRELRKGEDNDESRQSE